MDTGNGLNKKDSNFGNLVKGRTDEVVTNAWGGYMDAGDWDRRVQHLKASLLLLELAELFPDYLSGRLAEYPGIRQRSAGHRERGAVEPRFFPAAATSRWRASGAASSPRNIPRRGEASFQESLTVMAYAPGHFLELRLCRRGGPGRLVAGIALSRTGRPSTAKARCGRCTGPSATANARRRST